MFKSLKRLRIPLLCLAAGTLFSACLGSDDSTEEVTNECVVKAVSLGTLKRTMRTRTADGKRDSTYVITVKPALYPLTIDQQKNLIYNVDSLPYNTNVSKVVISSLLAQGTYAIKTLTTAVDTLLSLKDSLDFSKPRTIVIYGADGVSRRNYTMELRVHQEEGDSIHWQQMTDAQWAAQGFAAPVAGTFSAAGRTFCPSATGIDSSSDGSTWTSDAIDAADLDKLPTTEICGAAQPLRTDTALSSIVMYGVQQGESRVWMRTLDRRGTYNFSWNYLPVTSENLYPAPALSQARLFAFDDGFLLIGLDAAGKLTLRYSIDRGRSWKSHPSFRLPVISTAVHQLEAALDQRQNLWLRLNRSEVWRGHLNRLNWQQPKTIFYKSKKQ